MQFVNFLDLYSTLLYKLLLFRCWEDDNVLCWSAVCLITVFNHGDGQQLHESDASVSVAINIQEYLF